VKCTVYASFWPFTATSRGLPVKWRHFRVTSAHLSSRDGISCHVIAFSCELEACRKWNVQYTPVFGLLQPLPGDVWWNYVTSGSLPVTWGHVTSFPVTSLPPPASKSLVGSEMYCIRQFSAFYSHFQATSGKMTSLPGHFRSPEVTLRHFLSRDASSCELQPCRKWNVQYTPVFGLLQPLPSNFRSNDVISKSLMVTWGHVMPLPVTWLPPLASYSLVGSEMYSIREFWPSTATSWRLPVKWHHFRVTSDHLRSRYVISCTWLPPHASYSLVGSEMYSIRQFSALYSHFQATSGQMTPLPGHLWSPEVTWCHFLSRDRFLLRATAL